MHQLQLRNRVRLIDRQQWQHRRNLVVGHVELVRRADRHRNQRAQRVGGGPFTAAQQDPAITVGDRRQRHVVERHAERLAHLLHISQPDPGRTVASHRRHRAGQRRRPWRRAEQTGRQLGRTYRGVFGGGGRGERAARHPAHPAQRVQAHLRQTQSRPGRLLRGANVRGEGVAAAAVAELRQHLGCRDAVGDAVVNLGQHGPPVVAQAFDDPGLPRALAVEPPLHRSRDQLEQFGVAAGVGQRDAVQVA